MRVPILSIRRASQELQRPRPKLTELLLVAGQLMKSPARPTRSESPSWSVREHSFCVRPDVEILESTTPWRPAAAFLARHEPTPVLAARQSTEAEITAHDVDI